MQTLLCRLGTLLLLVSALGLAAAPITDVPIHDPVIIRQDGTYYLFATGPGIAVWSSPDRVHWNHEAPVFAHPPAWAVAAVPGFEGHVWAPDISYYDGHYYLYYAVSTFGKNRSAIGVATNATLDPRAPGFAWVDHGAVLTSAPGVTPWNAIDPNLIVDDAGTPFLTFGSFWDGIKLVKLRPDRLQPAEPLDHLPTLASRRKVPTETGDNPIEAPFLFKHAGYYYLFASIDYCCRGVKSTYKMIIGRSAQIAGPYLDQQGKPMEHGGGTLLLAGDSHWYGVGHNGIGSFDGTDYIVFHGYDASDPHGRSKLQLYPLRWTDSGWPVVEKTSAASLRKISANIQSNQKPCMGVPRLSGLRNF